MSAIIISRLLDVRLLLSKQRKKGVTEKGRIMLEKEMLLEIGKEIPETKGKDKNKDKVKDKDKEKEERMLLESQSYR